jgi:hypothetical protein
MDAPAIVTLIGLAYGALVALARWQEQRQADARLFRREFPAAARTSGREIDA